jgi:hypothetical protein
VVGLGWGVIVDTAWMCGTGRRDRRAYSEVCNLQYDTCGSAAVIIEPTGINKICNNSTP